MDTELKHTEIQTIEGTSYVCCSLTGDTVSPPYTDRGVALTKAREIEALPEDERRLVLAGRKPAPGCDWLIGGASKGYEVAPPPALFSQPIPTVTGHH
jgi:hypothetical protein